MQSPHKLSALAATLALLMVWGAPAGSQAATLKRAAPSCAPSMNTGVASLAPHLWKLREMSSPGDCPGISVIGSSNQGKIVWGISTQSLWKSTDNLATWNLVTRTPSPWTPERILPLSKGGALLEVSDFTDPDPSKRTYQILRSLDRVGSTFNFNKPVFRFPKGSRLRSLDSWLEISGSVLVSEYGLAPSDVNVWRSSDGGRSFKTLKTWPGGTGSPDSVRHIHALLADPYVKGRIWITIGDTGPQPRIGYSDDGGSTFKWIVQGRYYTPSKWHPDGTPQSRAVGLMFSPDAVYWATDSPELPALLSKYDRVSGEVSVVLSGLNGPYFGGLSTNRFMMQVSEVSTLAGDGYIGDEFPHVLTSLTDGSDWAQSTLPWIRSTALPQKNLEIVALTNPDATGRFWLSMRGTEKARTALRGGPLNVQLQLTDQPHL